MALVLGYCLLSLGLNDRNYKKEFESNGVQTTATLIGYRYITHTHRSPDGDRPIFSYTANDGIQRTYIAYEYGLATDLKKRVLSTQKVKITYLPYNPSEARIQAWAQLSDGTFLITAGIIVCLMSFALIISTFL